MTEKADIALTADWNVLRLAGLPMSAFAEADMRLPANVTLYVDEYLMGYEIDRASELVSLDDRFAVIVEPGMGVIAIPVSQILRIDIDFHYREDDEEVPFDEGDETDLRRAERGPDDVGPTVYDPIEDAAIALFEEQLHAAPNYKHLLPDEAERLDDISDQIADADNFLDGLGAFDDEDEG